MSQSSAENASKSSRISVAGLASARVPAVSGPVAGAQHAARDLVDRLLTRIVVAPSEFVFHTIELHGDLVHAVVTPDDLDTPEPGPVASVEAARHLSTVAACAASLHPDAPAGRHAYPVRRAVLCMNPVLRHLDRTHDLCLLEASCGGFDRERKIAPASATMRLRDGRLVARLACDLAVVDEDRLRSSCAGGPPSVECLATRRAHRSRVAPSDRGREGEGFFLQFEIAPPMCTGYALGLPVLSATSIGRLAMQAVRAAAAAQGEHVLHMVDEALIDLHRFVTAGERARFVASGHHDQWSCAVRVADELVASFHLRLLRSAPPHRGPARACRQ